jgi:hypothetical protein
MNKAASNCDMVLLLKDALCFKDSHLVDTLFKVQHFGHIVTSLVVMQRPNALDGPNRHSCSDKIPRVRFL